MRARTIKTQQLHSGLIDLALSCDPPPKQLVVGFSGGLDSCVLLHLVKSWQQQHPQVEIAALHVNHQLQPEADSWQQHCQRLCADWGIALESLVVEVDTSQSSLEQAARQARYDAFQNHLSAQQFLLLAHHRDDQVETLLQRLARGSGPLGLGAMMESTPRGHLTLLRPLLNYDREQLECYASEHQLSWVDDPSNQSDQFERNFLRHQILPIWRQKRPQLNQALARSARLCQQSAQLLDELAQMDLGETRSDQGLAMTKLDGLSPPRQHNLLRHWIRLGGYSLPSASVLERIVPEVVSAQADAQPQVGWGSAVLRRFNNVLYLVPRQLLQCAAHTPVLPSEILRGGRVAFPYGELTFTAVSEVADKATCLSIEACGGRPLRVSQRQGGEQVRPLGRHRKRLKDWLQIYQVPPWLRGHWPIIYCGDEIVAVAGLFVCQGFAAQASLGGVQISWQWQLGLIESDG